MKRYYYPYHIWEDWKAGMWKLDVENIDELKNKCIMLLSNTTNLKESMIFVSENWVYSARMNLGNRSRNRQAWLGQAACCFKHGIPEWLTRECWALLTDEQRNEANKIADMVIATWEVKNA